MKKYSALSPDFYYALDMMRLRNQLAKEMLLNMKDSQKASFTQKGDIKPIISTVSSLFLVRLKMSAELNVLKALGINSSYLHDMGAKELKTLLESLHDATTRATQELGRRSGLKT